MKTSFAMAVLLGLIAYPEVVTQFWGLAWKWSQVEQFLGKLGWWSPGVARIRFTFQCRVLKLQPHIAVSEWVLSENRQQEVFSVFFEDARSGEPYTVGSFLERSWSRFGRTLAPKTLQGPIFIDPGPFFYGCWEDVGQFSKVFLLFFKDV